MSKIRNANLFTLQQEAPACLKLDEYFMLGFVLNLANGTFKMLM